MGLVTFTKFIYEQLNCTNLIYMMMVFNCGT